MKSEGAGRRDGRGSQGQAHFLALFERMDVPSIRMWEVNGIRDLQRKYEGSGLGHVRNVPETLSGRVWLAIGPTDLEFCGGNHSVVIGVWTPVELWVRFRTSHLCVMGGSAIKWDQVGEGGAISVSQVGARLVGGCTCEVKGGGS